jgi:hypothetical protein
MIQIPLTKLGVHIGVHYYSRSRLSNVSKYDSSLTLIEAKLLANWMSPRVAYGVWMNMSHCHYARRHGIFSQRTRR